MQKRKAERERPVSVNWEYVRVWACLLGTIVFGVGMIGLAVFAGYVKWMAYWRLAFGQ